MARRAPESVAPPSPPRRVTRARTRNAVVKEDTSNSTAPATGVTAAPKRGRPKKQVTAAADTSLKTNDATKLSVSTTAPPKRRPAKSKPVKPKDESESSDDEMNVVMVQKATKSRATNTQSQSTGSTIINKSKGNNVNDGLDDKDDDDELAQTKQSNVRPRKANLSAARKNKSTASEVKAKSLYSARKKSSSTSGTGTSRTAKSSSASIDSDKASKSVPITTALAKNKSAGTVIKKKVTFLDIAEDSDKENQPLPVLTNKGKPKTGLKAKPARRPTTPVSCEDDQSSSTRPQSKKEPLSPKKPSQLAKSTPVDDSDNFRTTKEHTEIRDGPKTPQRSPMKQLSLGPSLTSPAKKIDFSACGRVTEAPIIENQGESTDGTTPIMLDRESTMIMSTPARRLPPSPFKDCMKESPKRAPITFELASRPRIGVSSVTKPSPLKESPRKGKVMVLPPQSLIINTESPSKDKASYLQSPAKRLTSPSKQFPPTPIYRQELCRRQDVAPGTKALDETVEDSVLMRKDEGSNSVVMDSIDYDTVEEIIEEEMPFDSPPNALDVETPRSTAGVQLPIQVDDPFISPYSSCNSPVREYEVSSRSSSAMSIRCFDIAGIPPPAPSPPSFGREYPHKFGYRDNSGDGESDAEPTMIISPIRGSNKRQSIRLVNETDNFEDETTSQSGQESNINFTPLVNKLNQWKPGTEERKYPRRRGVFSLSPNEQIDIEISRRSLDNKKSCGQLSHRSRRSTIIAVSECEDGTVIHDSDISMDDDFSSEGCNFSILEDAEDTILEDVYSELNDCESLASDSQNYSANDDLVLQEQTITVNAAMFEEPQHDITSSQRQLPVLPMSVTPVRSGPRYPRTIHTVSKVPLKTEDGSLRIPRKRARSFSSSASPLTAFTIPTINKSKTLPSPSKGRSSVRPSIPTDQIDKKPPSSYSSPEKSRLASPSKTRSPSKSPQKQPSGNICVLQGAVVYADIHTKEGADASGIFVELLTQMGARCVKSWNWNPRISLSPVDGVEPKGSKIGITHVVFKDGGVRTLEKVRQANGVVKCVGVNWVLDCERSNKWLDEVEYAVDTAMIPRGGQKRRKSMEPRSLGNSNGTVVALDSSTSSASSIDSETMQEFMRLSRSPTPRSSRDSSVESEQHELEDVFATPKPRKEASPSMGPIQPPETPGYVYSYDYDPATAMSPTTPYYLSQGAKLVQQTCPPKQLHQGLFSATESCSSERSESLRIRLEAARRKSLIWKPKIGSPLGRM
ncbi:hypothetical protein LOZ65_000818 [Ophidiomyces ophidiicola]|nr:hypothetical protein LOZ65_000818 [Ophidiomyces ophidiicola]